MRSSFTKKEWLLLIALSAVTFSGALVASLQAPFYPQEAESKGATATEYGLVFGIFELATFISSPIFGSCMGLLGADLVLKCGILITGISSIAFGMLSYVEGHVWFIGLSFLVRIVEAFGIAAMVTAGLSIVVATFSDSFARVFTTLEIFQGLGYMVGPTVGGLLFELGGFICPFAVVGVFVMFNGCIIVCTLPQTTASRGGHRQSTTITSVLKILPVALDALCIVTEAISLGFLMATLEPHLREFQLSPSALGGVFVISGLVYTMTSPVVGYLCDKGFNPKRITMVGCLVTIISFMFIGPVPFTPFEKTLWLVGIGLVLDGIGTSMLFVPSFVDAIQSSVKYGLPNDITTYAMVSGIYASAFALGSFIGPSIAGVLFDTVGFREGTIFVIALHMLLFCAIGWFLCGERRYNQRYLLSSIKTEAEVIVTSADAIAVKVIEEVSETLPLSTSVKALRKSGYDSISQNGK